MQTPLPASQDFSIKNYLRRRTAPGIGEGVLSAIGNTPLVRLTKVIGNAPLTVYAKLEGLNPGGSVKDRTAYNVIAKAIEAGEIRADTVVIESTSGNMGVGLAQVCAYLGLRFIAVVDPKTTAQNISILRAYGATLECVTEPHPKTGEYLQSRLDRVSQLCATIRNSYWPNQHANRSNPETHYSTTFPEIASLLGDKIDYLFCATSTCGTILGCAQYVRQQGLGTKVIAVDAIGSVIFGGVNGKRLIPGHGAAVVPALLEPGLVDQCVHVSDLDCVVGCRRLVRREAILVGGSSGGVFMALEQVKESLPRGSTCVLIFADRGERYLDTIYSDEWVEQELGNVSHLWEEAKLES
jgi:N-(2-amino-2-carboxyethyl)-L-glutamate synthase